MANTTPIRNQVNELWQQAVDQLEEVKETLLQSRSKLEHRFEADVIRLKRERERLLKMLGEQTYKLANQGKLPLPGVVKRTIDRLNKVIDRMIEKEKRGGGKRSPKGTGAKKKTAKKKTAKKA
jgi:hypothetical protein